MKLESYTKFLVVSVVPIFTILFYIPFNTQKHIKRRKRIRNIRKKLTTEKRPNRLPYKNLK
jgi:hypothetical protein